jgi:peroxiredoxin
MSRLLAVCVLGVGGVLTQVTGAVPDDPTRVVPVALGTQAPAFRAHEVDGRAYEFRPTALNKPVLLIFYRGGWCPYCNAHLHELRFVEPKLRALGYEVLFLSTDRPALLYASLKERVHYHIVSDADMAAARAFGVAYRVDAQTLRMMQTYGIDLTNTQGTANHELPVPSVFIVDRHGVVRFRHFNPDYKVRLDGASVLKAAQDALRPPH